MTPFLLSCLAERTGGASLEANLALLESNARLAGRGGGRGQRSQVLTIAFEKFQP